MDVRIVKPMVVADIRITGYKLQQRRLRLWQRNPRCVVCGRVTEYPHGFDLDHTVPLYLGGEDVDGNCQILCNGPEGCHHKKTRNDMNQSK
ncbi:HNH endonuclease [Serratia sp. M24T3]|uniref:HNH endonuclease n=1 Tax=Serratia sp. M24T3 TaxID=932213 RepID=UPI0002F89808|nr:HNH endonuclease signature motif containing protein [Serratia sp. M24T3]